MTTTKPPVKLRLVPTKGVHQPDELQPIRLTSRTKGVYKLDELSSKLMLSVLEDISKDIDKNPDHYAVGSPYGLARVVWDYLRVQHDKKATSYEKLAAHHVVRKEFNERGLKMKFE
jgi:hypothetical protein